jgi:hypothetical protein
MPMKVRAPPHYYYYYYYYHYHHHHHRYKFLRNTVPCFKEILWKYLTVLRHSEMFFVLKFELILIIGSNKVLTEGARIVYRRQQGALDRAGLDNRLIDGKVISPTHRLHFTPQKLFFLMFPVLISVRGWVNPRESSSRYRKYKELACMACTNLIIHHSLDISPIWIICVSN